MKVIVAITGATGSIFGIRILEILKEIKEVETHLILSDWARKNIETETNYKVEEIEHLADNLISRAADVILKERRKLILLTRETPLNTIHLENMLELSRMGTIILPPIPAFYNHPKTIDDIVSHIAYRTVDQLGIILPGLKRWEG